MEDFNNSELSALRNDISIVEKALIGINRSINIGLQIKALKADSIVLGINKDKKKQKVKFVSAATTNTKKLESNYQKIKSAIKLITLK